MRNSNTLKVLLFARDTSNNPEKLTIYARIPVNGKRAEISLKRYVSVNEWDETRGRLNGLTQKARLLNSYLQVEGHWAVMIYTEGLKIPYVLLFRHCANL